MRHFIISILYWISYSTGIFKIFRFFSRHKVIIVVYHNPAPEVLEKHLKYFTKHYNIITLSEYVESLETDKYDQLPENSIILTFDDGHKNNYYLLPIIKRYNIRPTIYLTSEVVGTNKHFWWSKLKDKSEISYLKSIKNIEKNLILLKKYNYSLNSDFSINNREALSFEEISEMNEFVDFQSHTNTHPILTQCNEEELLEELLLSKQKLEKLLNKSIIHLSYPNGNYNNDVIARTKTAGYHSARTTKCGLNSAKTDLCQLKILGVSETDTKHRLELDLLGFPLWIINMQRKLSGKN